LIFGPIPGISGSNWLIMSYGHPYRHKLYYTPIPHPQFFFITGSIIFFYKTWYPDILYSELQCNWEDKLLLIIQFVWEHSRSVCEVKVTKVTQIWLDDHEILLQIELKWVTSNCIEKLPQIALRNVPQEELRWIYWQTELLFSGKCTSKRIETNKFTPNCIGKNTTPKGIGRLLQIALGGYPK
jgi:hypothetical protein